MPAGWNNPEAKGLIVPLGANLTMEPLPAVLFPPLLTYRLPFESKARPVGPPSPKFATNVVTAPCGVYLTIDPVEARLIAKRLPSASNAIPAGIAFDAEGNLFAINRASTGSIVKYTPQGAVTTFVANLGDGGPTGLAFDSNGNLYVSKGGNNTAGSGSIVKFAPNGTMSPFASGLFQPAGMAVDGANNVYVADLGSGSIFRFT